MRLTVRSVGADGWPLIAELFGERGACGGCWCMWPRVSRPLFEAGKGSGNRDALRRLVEAGAVHAVVAFAGAQPVGWCSFGPRATFPRLENARSLRRQGTADTWSIVCFYIPAAWRGQGVAGRLLAAATREARRRGAREIEGYPVRPGRGGKLPGPFAWTGVPVLFDRAGYRPLEPTVVGKRPIYLKRID